jgi:lipopolysaccharide transport system ATP-binding protein
MTGELHVEGLGKAYRNWGTEWRRVASWFMPTLRPLDERWVLRDVSFSVSPAEALGIVGQNGAGKSTLLKLITGTTRPTAGSVHVNGRVAAILELGMGFHPELTGRQNAWHAVGLMGFLHDEIARAIPEIEAFADIGAYFDQPVRTYSSGMQVRVAFSVVTAFRPDILIVDEALSVGDAYFQHKSFDRIRQFQKQGTTLLIVSHDRAAVQGLANRAILLEKGVLLKDGSPEEVMDFYNAIIADKEGQKISTGQHASGKVQTVSGNGAATVEAIQLLNMRGEPLEIVDVGEPVELVISTCVSTDLPQLVLGYMIKDRFGQAIFGTNTCHTKQIVERVRAGEKIRYRIRFPMNIGPGTYSISTALVDSDNHLTNNYEWRDVAAVFNVHNADKQYFIGSSWLPPTIEIQRS